MQKNGHHKMPFFGTLLCMILTMHISVAEAFGQLSTARNYKSSHFTEASSVEIWSRVRDQFHLNAPTSMPSMQKQIRKLTRSQGYINELANNASPYLYYILEEVEKRGMPSEIALLPMIESTFNPHAASNKGAAGLWQLMPSLGRLYGLKQNAWYDGRKDIYESTKVALDHLEYLHKRFNGNWLLALAAYNSGETKVMTAIRINRMASKGTDFWSLKLPKETSEFVPKLLALAALIKAPKQYGVSLPSIPNKQVFTRINTGRAMDISHAAKLVDVSENQLRKLNPGLHKRSMNPQGPFNLVVPVKGAKQFTRQQPTVPKPTATTTSSTTAAAAAKPAASATTKPIVVANTAVKESSKPATAAKMVSTSRYQIKKGDNIEKIAKQFHTTPAAIQKLNGMPNDVVVIGKTLMIPGSQTALAVKQASSSPKLHIVKKGESLPLISEKHHVKLSDLLAYNHFKSQSTIIRPGQKIKLSHD
ncbi:MAG TPA: transglycosylase SLT domain-containing protein [Candidatus Berkiella sp.]|nr:transglycosylase SLT domain-containing protein [Candidatus Berkiella sp.]